MTNKKHQQPTSSSTYFPSHDSSARTLQKDDCLCITMKHELPSATERKSQVQNDARSQRKVTSTTGPQTLHSSFELGLMKVPLDMDYSVNRYLSHVDASAAPTGILSKQITKARDTRKSEGHGRVPGVDQSDIARLLAQVGAWTVVDKPPQNGRWGVQD